MQKGATIMDIIGYALGGSLVVWGIWKWVVVPLLVSPPPDNTDALLISSEGREELTRLRVAVIGSDGYGGLMEVPCYVPDWSTLKALCDEYGVPFDTTDISVLENSLQDAIIVCHRITPSVDAGTPVTT